LEFFISGKKGKLAKRVNLFDWLDKANYKTDTLNDSF
jgi:hypothetical protein